MASPYSSKTAGQVEPAAPRVSVDALLVGAILVAGLFLARDVLVPIALAVLLSFVLAIPAKKLQALGLGRIFPVALVVMIAFGAILSISVVLVSQLTELAGDLPRYQFTIREKIASLKTAAAGSGPTERLANMIQGLSDELSGHPPGAAATAVRPGEATPDKPLPVEIARSRESAIATLSGYVAPVLHPLATAGLVAIFTIFMLLQRGDLRNRAIRLAGSHDLQRTTAAMNDAANRLSSFFLVQVLLNSGFGILVGVGLWLIGVPSPILWGILAAVSRFVPYVGVVLAAGGPLILAAAVDPHWTMLAITAAFFAGSELLLGQVVEPLVYGHSTGLSPVAVLLSVTFWTWLWGPVGLILSTPLTVCLVVLGRHVDRLEFLDVMLGDRPPLTVVESFYQRVLAGDAGEAAEQAEDFIRSHALLTFYDEVAVKALALAQADLHRGALDEARQERVSRTFVELLDDLADQPDEGADREAKKAEVKRAAGDQDLDLSLEAADERAERLAARTGQVVPPWTDPAAVLCVPARNDLDRVGAQMLAQMLSRYGFGASVEADEAGGSSTVMRLPDPATRIVCLVSMDQTSPVHVRYAVRRLRRRLPEIRIFVAAWGADEDGAKALCESSKSDGCTGRIADTVALCFEEAGFQAPVEDRPEAAPAGAEPATIAA